MSQYGPCGSHFQKNLNSSLSKDFQTAKKETQQFLKNETLVRSYSYQFKFPDELSLNIVLRKAESALTDFSNSYYALIDKDGYVVSYQESTFLPVVKTKLTPPNVGEKVQESLIFALDMIKTMFTLYEVREGEILGTTGLMIKLNDGNTVIFPLTGDKDILVASLQVILSQLNSNSSDTKIGKALGGNVNIDLRYKNPVIK